MPAGFLRPRRHPYEVHGTKGAETLVIGCDTKEVAEDTARAFRSEGYLNVRIIEVD